MLLKIVITASLRLIIMLMSTIQRKGDLKSIRFFKQKDIKLEFQMFLIYLYKTILLYNEEKKGYPNSILFKLKKNIDIFNNFTTSNTLFTEYLIN